MVGADACLAGMRKLVYLLLLFGDESSLSRVRQLEVAVRLVAVTTVGSKSTTSTTSSCAHSVDIAQPVTDLNYLLTKAA